MVKQRIRQWIPQPLYAWGRYVALFGRAWLRGERAVCPFCHHPSAVFLPSGFKFPVLKQYQVIGGGYRPRARCSHCDSVDRERLIYLYLQQHLPHLLTPPTHLLHIAPEKNLGRTLHTALGAGYVSADLFPPHVHIQMDLTAVPHPTATYDAILCSHVLEHIPDDAQAMRELYRILKPSGVAILQVPISYILEHTIEDFSLTTPAQRQEAFGQDDHVRIYGRDYAQRLQQAGFHVTPFDMSTSLTPAQMNQYGLQKEEKLFVCTKIR